MWRAMIRSYFGAKVKTGEIYIFDGCIDSPFDDNSNFKVEVLDVKGKWVKFRHMNSYSMFQNERMKMNIFRFCYKFLVEMKKQPHEILEELSKRGYAPTLLYDDDGHWRVSGDGISPVFGEPGSYTSFVEEGEEWYDNITDAVNAYLKETEEDI